jgi:hypothetical protein
MTQYGEGMKLTGNLGPQCETVGTMIENLVDPHIVVGQPENIFGPIST